MYNYNTLESKIRRVEELRKLQSKIGTIPGTYLSYTEAVSLGHYLGDIISDLEKQIRAERNPRSVKDRAEAVRKALSQNWGTKFADNLEEQLDKCKTEEEVAQLYDRYIAPTR